MAEVTNDLRMRLDYTKPTDDEAALAAKRERLQQLDIRPAVTVYKTE